MDRGDEAAVEWAIREGLAGSAAVVVAPSGSCVRRPFRLEAIHHAGARASQGGDAACAGRPDDARRRVFRPPPRVGSAPSGAPAPESLRGSASIDAVTMDASDDDFWETRARKLSVRRPGCRCWCCRLCCRCCRRRCCRRCCRRWYCLRCRSSTSASSPRGTRRARP